MHCAERRRRNWFSPWSGTLNHKAANSAASGQTLGRNSGLLPPAPVVKTQHNAQEWTVSIDVIFKANPAGPTCCSPGPPYRTPEISLLTLWNQTRAFSSGLSFQNQIQKISIEGLLFLGKFHGILLNPSTCEANTIIAPFSRRGLRLRKIKGVTQACTDFKARSPLFELLASVMIGCAARTAACPASEPKPQAKLGQRQVDTPPPTLLERF